jgi:hypothetical protein
MPRYASGKYALGISDRSGRAYSVKDLVKEWTGLMVGRDEFESKQPQLSPRPSVADPEALKFSRPDRLEPVAEILLPNNPFESPTAGSSIIRVTEPGSIRELGDIVRFRSTQDFDGFTSTVLEYSTGYAITEVFSDTVRYSYTVDVSSSGSSETATVGGVQGGGGVASSGPVTVSA